MKLSVVTYPVGLLEEILGLAPPWLLLSRCLEDSSWVGSGPSTGAILLRGRGAVLVDAVALTLVSLKA